MMLLIQLSVFTFNIVLTVWCIYSVRKLHNKCYRMLNPRVWVVTDPAK